MDAEIELQDIKAVIGNLKHNKAPGVTRVTSEFYKNFNRDVKIWTLQYIRYTEEIGQLSYLQRQCSITLIPNGQKNKRELGNWRTIKLINTLYKIISTILAYRIKKSSTKNNR